ncbi:unnamed protein product [Closterium sp. NIES-54]
MGLSFSLSPSSLVTCLPPSLLSSLQLSFAANRPYGIVDGETFLLPPNAFQEKKVTCGAFAKRPFWFPTDSFQLEVYAAATVDEVANGPKSGLLGRKQLPVTFLETGAQSPSSMLRSPSVRSLLRTALHHTAAHCTAPPSTTSPSHPSCSSRAPDPTAGRSSCRASFIAIACRVNSSTPPSQPATILPSLTFASRSSPVPLSLLSPTPSLPATPGRPIPGGSAAAAAAGTGIHAGSAAAVRAVTAGASGGADAADWQAGPLWG